MDEGDQTLKSQVFIQMFSSWLKKYVFLIHTKGLKMVVFFRFQKQEDS